MRDDPGKEAIDALIAADILWREIDIGDLIMLEGDLHLRNRLQLQARHPYQVLCKMRGASGAQRFVVQSDQTQEVIEVYPAQLCSYQEAQGPVFHA